MMPTTKPLKGLGWLIKSYDGYKTDQYLKKTIAASHTVRTHTHKIRKEAAQTRGTN